MIGLFSIIILCFYGVRGLFIYEIILFFFYFFVVGGVIFIIIFIWELKKKDIV